MIIDSETLNDLSCPIVISVSIFATGKLSLPFAKTSIASIMFSISLFFNIVFVTGSTNALSGITLPKSVSV